MPKKNTGFPFIGKNSRITNGLDKDNILPNRTRQGGKLPQIERQGSLKTVVKAGPKKATPPLPSQHLSLPPPHQVFDPLGPPSHRYIRVMGKRAGKIGVPKDNPQDNPVMSIRGREIINSTPGNTPPRTQNGIRLQTPVWIAGAPDNSILHYVYDNKIMTVNKQDIFQRKLTPKPEWGMIQIERPSLESQREIERYIEERLKPDIVQPRNGFLPNIFKTN